MTNSGYADFKANRPLSLWIIIFVALIGTGCATTPMTTARQHPELEQRLPQIKTIAILPVEVALLHKTVNGDELQPEEERKLQSSFMTTLGRTLESKRYQAVRIEAASSDTMKAGSEEIRKIREEAASISDQISQAVPVSETTVTLKPLGSAVQTLTKSQKADALLVARYNGHDSSGGRTAMRVITAGIVGGLTGGHAVTPSSAGGECELLLIDGRNGDVLWTNHLAGSTDRRLGQTARGGYYGPSDMMLKAINMIPERPIAQ